MQIDFFLIKLKRYCINGCDRDKVQNQIIGAWNLLRNETEKENASGSLSTMRLVCYCTKHPNVKEGAPLQPMFALPPWNHPWVDLIDKQHTCVRDDECLMSTKFHQNTARQLCDWQMVRKKRNTDDFCAQTNDTKEQIQKDTVLLTLM